MKCYYCGKPAERVVNGESMCESCLSWYYVFLWIILISIVLFIIFV